MIDYQRTIDNIRSILASAAPPSMENVWAVAVEYADACDAVNERLRGCGQLLRDGLRSEAIQRCEMEPNLLNLMATLDFPESYTWTALLQANGLAPPSPLLVDVASDLNEAYAQEEPLKAALRRHRLLALGRCPLRDRIATLRNLARLDVNNAVWQDDLRTYEKTRQQEIHRAIDLEYSQGNLFALRELEQDVQSGDWLDPLPAALVQKAHDAHARLLREHARSELERFEPQLNDAFSQFDVIRGRSLRERWNSSLSFAQLPSDDSLLDRVSPALEWLKQQDRESADEAGYKSALAQLEQALDNEEDLGNLERLAHAVLRFERSIPDVLEKRLQGRMASLELAKSRRARLIIAALFAAVLLVGGVVGYGIVNQQHEEQVTSHATTIQTFIDQRQFDDAKKHLDQLIASAPSVAADPRIQQLDVKLNAQIREEYARQAEFKSAIEAAEQAGTEDPDRQSLEAAGRIAILDSEKARVLKLQTLIAEVDLRRQKERDDTFLERLRVLTSRLNELDRNHPDEKLLALIRTSLAALRSDNSQISPPVFEPSSVLQTKIDAFYKTIERQQALEKALAVVHMHVGNADKFRAALEDFTQQFPEAAEASDFKRTISEAGLWKDVEDWNRFIERWQTGDVTRLAAGRVKELLAASSTLLQDHGSHPVAAELRKRIPHLEAILQRVDEGGTKLHAPLNELFTDPLVARLWMVRIVDDKGNSARYYLIAPPPQPLEGLTSIQLAYISDFSRNANTHKRVTLDSIKYSGQAPQSIVAKFAMDELAKLGDNSWEQGFASIAKAIIGNDQLDPILKVIFLQKVLDVACQGSHCLQSAFAHYREILGSSGIDPALPWMDVKSEDARRARELAEDLLHRLPPMPQVIQDTAMRLKELRSPLGPTYQWVGWLVRDKDGWKGRLQSGGPDSSKLFMAVPRIGEEAWVWTEVGRIQAGKPELEPSKVLALVQGRPLFAVKDPSPPKGTASK
jgi:hypothetical protein